MHKVKKRVRVSSHTRKKPGGGSTKVKGYTRNIDAYKLSKTEKRKLQRKRSKRAKVIDHKKTAKIPKDERAWKKNPRRYDLKGVDTAQSPPPK